MDRVVSYRLQSLQGRLVLEVLHEVELQDVLGVFSQRVVLLFEVGLPHLFEHFHHLFILGGGVLGLLLQGADQGIVEVVDVGEERPLVLVLAEGRVEVVEDVDQEVVVVGDRVLRRHRHLLQPVSLRHFLLLQRPLRRVVRPAHAFEFLADDQLTIVSPLVAPDFTRSRFLLRGNAILLLEFLGQKVQVAVEFELSLSPRDIDDEHIGG